MVALRFPNVEIIGLLSFQFERDETISNLKNKFNLGLHYFAFTLGPATIVEKKRKFQISRRSRHVRRSRLSLYQKEC